MTKCPHCFHALTQNRVAYLCTNTCPEVHDTAFSEFHGREQYNRPLTVLERPTDSSGKPVRRWDPPKSVPCRQCQGPTIEVCATCHFNFPPGWRGTETVTLALAGARDTGKSVYIGVMIKELERLVEAQGSTLTRIGATETNYEIEYERPLYQARGMLRPTAAANSADAIQRYPLIFSLGRFQPGGKEIYLALRDVAGEDLQNRGAPPHLKFFSQADLVLFLFDPTQVKEITDELQGRLASKNKVGSSPNQVLQYVLTLIGEGAPALGVAVSKFDTVQMLAAGKSPDEASGVKTHVTNWPRRLGNVGAAFNREARGVSYDETDGDQIHEEERSLLMALGATGMVNAVENPRSGRQVRHRFFAVSALGAPANINGQDVKGIAPFRVLDPLRWVMAQKQLLEVKK